MSQENVEVAARIYELWRTSKAEVLANLPRMMDFCHPEVEWSQREEGWTHRGRDGVREALELWLESFDDYRYEVQRIVAIAPIPYPAPNAQARSRLPRVSNAIGPRTKTFDIAHGTFPRRRGWVTE